jgi:hypothetical protein
MTAKPLLRDKRTGAILFSANPKMVDLQDAMDHLTTNRELYWATGAQMKRGNFAFPLLGLIHVNGVGGSYQSLICDIIPFSTAHFNDSSVKPRSFRERWEHDPRERDRPWKFELVMTQLSPLSFDTLKLERLEGGFVKIAPRNYVRVIPPEGVRSGRAGGGSSG